MSSVSEAIVRVYFESFGYLVIQPFKYASASKRRRPEESIDLMIQNPLIKELVLPDEMIWTSATLKKIPAAVVGVSGWHTERFYPATFQQAPEIFKFAGEKSLAFAANKLGTKKVAKILCLPQLPVSDKLKTETVDLLRKKGIDGVLQFRTILHELISRISVNHNYEKSDILQTIRLLKNYDLLKDDQMELFAPKRRKRRSKTTQT